MASKKVTKLIHKIGMYLGILSKFQQGVVGKKAVKGVWTLQILLLVGLVCIVLYLTYPLNLLSSRLLALGASLQLLSVPLLVSAILEFFARPPRPEKKVGDAYLPSSTKEAEQSLVMGFALGLVLSLPKLRNIPFIKIRPWVTIFGVAFLVIGLLLQVISALIA